MTPNTNTVAPSVKCLHGAIESVSKNSEFFAQNQKCTQPGSSCKRISSCNGDLGHEAGGAFGYEITTTSYYERGHE